MSRAAVAAAGLAGLALLSLTIGVGDFDAFDLTSDRASQRLLWVSRLPRTLAVLLTGASMATAGVIMQVIARNRFVEPTTAGTGQGAALGLLAVTLFAPATPLFLRMAAASLAALASTAVFLVIVRRLPPTQPLLVPLVGLVYGGVLGAAETFIAYQADLLQYLAVWLNGEFSGVLAGRYELLWVSGAVAALAYLVADRFTIASLGRDASLGLGLNYRRIVGLGLAMVAIITALVVVTVGMIPFVGLVVPNLVSRVMGDNLRRTLPWVALTGAGLVLVCDILGRLIRYPYEIPVGTVFGVVGSVLFLYLLLHEPRRAA
ncbi:MAG TPA: iron chelate uptake ABC transporter family permease subunit [Amaricoccus sp.]|uniref:ABC transporter permease n=1 Tax=Amaricoccus sp. TaxID=1872485 RepID=UPI002B6A3C8D|nr:iron chelate uptake ABC transporter family permease subunit [Amaricoccus sp.]HMQ92281.1 iron chelate uptake ABC transporter family permease subunit [Amaricoccus sp.]HMR51052.1 iron chelate uptake ABC transporter family permease subunit [Amaricoccus sp.]HMR60747.1 iron chelate uptake ABC transporter family permease subunit [Amaricoccus sp.]HMT97769.1 iron chelate uptake ABC transporter family permease subunit [Amaricoccus sp.]